MLINKDFAFLHFPKTAGKSLTKYMVDAWEVPIHGRVSKGQVTELADVMRPGVTLEVTRGHEGMRQAAKVMRERGCRIQDLKAVFVCIRNPYDVAVSTYFYLRETFRLNRENPRFRRAAEMTFEDFWCSDPNNAPERWLALNGRVLPNRRLIRFECLREDLDELSKEFGFRPAELPHLNASDRQHYSAYMTPRAEDAIFSKYRYMFDAGFYPRESFEDLPRGAMP